MRCAAQERNLPLVVVGHSLGGGTAALTTMLFQQGRERGRQLPRLSGVMALLTASRLTEFPNIRCYAFAPAAVISANLCARSRTCVTTLVLHDDIVPRACTVNIEGGHWTPVVGGCDN